MSISSGTELAQRIALGTTVQSGMHAKVIEGSYINSSLHTEPLLIGTGRYQPMGGCLSEEELLIANSYWPMNDKKRLNKFQREAIKLAWGNKFTMIQGPPGV